MADCDGNCTACLRAAVEQPPDGAEWTTADGVFIKQMFIAKAGTMIPQHSHEYAHVSMLAVGSVRLWADGEPLGDFKAPMPLSIAAGTKHTFMALEDGTTVYCIHNLHGEKNITIREEHQFGSAA